MTNENGYYFGWFLQNGKPCCGKYLAVGGKLIGEALHRSTDRRMS